MRSLHRKSELGWTLLELISVMTISLIGFTGGFALLKLGYKSLHVSKAAAQSQEKIVLEKMIYELQETSPDTVDIEESDEAIAISFASARDEYDNFLTTEEGTPDWEYVVVYVLDSNTLYKYKATYDWSAAEFELPANPSVWNLDNLDLGAAQIILGDPNPEDSRYPGSEKAISVSFDPDDSLVEFQLSLNNSLSINIEFMKRVEGEEAEQSGGIEMPGELTTTVKLQN